MASNEFILRFKSEKGSYTVSDLTCDSTFEMLKLKLEGITQIKSRDMKFLSGYPRKPLIIEHDNLKLHELDIHSGDTIIIEIVKQPVKEIKGDFHDELMHQGGIMLRHVVPSNNSCLFTSINFILSNGETEGSNRHDLRSIIAKVVQNNSEKYNDVFLGKPNSEYCKWILDSNNWGGAIELSILSEHFQLEIVAIDTVSLTPHCFGENSNYSSRIFLIYDGIHYDPLIMELENAQQAIFLVSDQKPMELALEIAKEAKASHQFTDTANFKLCCKVCNEILKGEKEATEHALKTRHCEFGERL